MKKKPLRQVTFYRHGRRDGGVHIGIDDGEDLVLEHYKPGRVETDSVISWFIEIRCEGSGLPTDAEELKTWFLENAEYLKRGLEELAAEIPLGIDNDVDADHKTLAPIRGTKIVIVSFASTRPMARGMAAQIRDLAKHWEKVVHSLEPVKANAW